MLTQNFLLATNTGLTIEFGGYEDLTHLTDESDNPQDMSVLYLGAISELVMLRAASDPGVDNIVLTPTDILPLFEASTAYTSGQMTQPTTPNGFRYECTTAGTTSTEPTWPTSIGSTVISGTAVFTCRSPKHEITEITLALDSGDLGTNTPGDPLSLGNTILGGTSNKVAIYMRVENNVNIVSNNTSYPEIGIVINTVEESEI